MAEASEEQLENASRMRRMLFGQLASRALCLVAGLGIPDLLANGPRPTAELAAETGTDLPSLRRLLRGLAMHDVLREMPGDAYGLTPLGRTLCRDAPASAHPSAQLLSGVVGAAWAGLEQTVRTGKPVFDDIFGMDFFTYLESNSGVRETFSASQAEGLALEMGEISSQVDFSEYRNIVDIGGGEGTLLSHVLHRNPHAHGVLFELPGTAELARKFIAEQQLTHRCTTESGDFFRNVPGGGDAYLLSHILHDWNDRDAARLLRVCADTMPEHATLLIIDLVTAEQGGTDPGYRYAGLLDLYMLSLFGGDGGRERSASEFTALLGSVGFDEVTVRRLPSGIACVQAYHGRSRG